LRNVVSLDFGSKVTVEWLDWVVCKVITHEEPHPADVPQNLAPIKLATVTTEAHRIVDPGGTSTLSFLFVRKSKSNSGPEEAIANLQNKIRTIRGQKQYDRNWHKLLKKNKTITSKIIQIEVQLL
jgi:hypothetical protein